MLYDLYVTPLGGGPTLKIALGTGGKVVLTGEGAPDEWILERSDDLTPGSWQDLPFTAVLIPGGFTIERSQDGLRAFYRLRHKKRLYGRAIPDFFTSSPAATRTATTTTPPATSTAPLPHLRLHRRPATRLRQASRPSRSTRAPGRTSTHNRVSRSAIEGSARGKGGVNLYGFVWNDGVRRIDHLGLYPPPLDDDHKMDRDAFIRGLREGTGCSRAKVEIRGTKTILDPGKALPFIAPNIAPNMPGVQFPPECKRAGDQGLCCLRRTVHCPANRPKQQEGVRH